MNCETLQRGITKLYSVTFEEAADGGQEQVKLFQDLKLNVEELVDKLPIEKFLATSEAIGKIEDPTKRVYEAYKIFGKSGAELLEILEHSEGRTCRSPAAIGRRRAGNYPPGLVGANERGARIDAQIRDGAVRA